MSIRLSLLHKSKGIPSMVNHLSFNSDHSLVIVFPSFFHTPRQMTTPSSKGHPFLKSPSSSHHSPLKSYLCWLEKKSNSSSTLIGNFFIMTSVVYFHPLFTSKKTTLTNLYHFVWASFVTIWTRGRLLYDEFFDSFSVMLLMISRSYHLPKTLIH